MKNIKKLLLTTMMISPVWASDPDLEAAIAASLSFESARLQQEEDAFDERLQEALRRSVVEEQRRVEKERRVATEERLAKSAQDIIAAGRLNQDEATRRKRYVEKQTRERSLEILNLNVRTQMKPH